MKRLLVLISLTTFACGEAPTTVPVTAATPTTSVTPSQPETTAGKDGARGEAGPKGDAGARGERGDKGDKGDKGDSGKAGKDGLDGEAGAEGAQGEPGLDGKDGAKGDRGSDGAVGAKGDHGDVGAIGAKGDDGTVGATGATGANGTNGANGVAGATGSAGIAGTPGTTGATGAAGAQGVAGTSALTLKLIDANAADIGQVFWVDDSSGDYWTVKGSMRFEVSRYDGRFPLGYLFYSGLNCTGTLRATIVNGQFANVVQNGLTGQPVRMLGMSQGTFNYQSRSMATTNCQNASGSIDNSWPLETPTLGFGYPVVGAQIDNGSN